MNTTTLERLPAQARRPFATHRLIGALRHWLAGRIEALGAPADTDPTAHFGPRDWADLPVHHPASEER